MGEQPELGQESESQKVRRMRHFKTWAEYRSEAKELPTSTLKKRMQNREFNQDYKAVVRMELKRRGAFKSSRPARRQSMFGGGMSLFGSGKTIFG